MSEFKGTQGELRVIDDFECFRIDEIIQGNQAKRLAKVQKKGYPLGVCKANAALFSCAPEMLEMLIKLNSLCSMKIEDRNELKQLIKKATL